MSLPAPSLINPLSGTRVRRPHTCPRDSSTPNGHRRPCHMAPVNSTGRILSDPGNGGGSDDGLHNCPNMEGKGNGERQGEAGMMWEAVASSTSVPSLTRPQSTTDQERRGCVTTPRTGSPWLSHPLSFIQPCAASSLDQHHNKARPPTPCAALERTEESLAWAPSTPWPPAQ
uniref:Uncharacterized protein n=1 Tax=Arundo donax TaxID=35708 RepID=A0A0A9CT66_ARUDO